MKSLHIPFKEALTPAMSMQNLSQAMDKLDQNPIEEMPWPIDYKPRVNFAIAHNDVSLLVKFYVSEQTIRAVYHRTNEPVYKDTCVEAFIAFGRETGYYNFEFNCLGTCLAGYGSGRKDREAFREENIARIKRLSSIETSNDTPFAFKWQLTVVIPLQVFYKNHFTHFRGMEGRANFYKCGDDLPQPHYLAWNNIEAAAPDFHLPAFFGKMKFA